MTIWILIAFSVGAWAPNGNTTVAVFDNKSQCIEALGKPEQYKLPKKKQLGCVEVITQ